MRVRTGGRLGAAIGGIGIVALFAGAYAVLKPGLAVKSVALNPPTVQLLPTGWARITTVQIYRRQRLVDQLTPGRNHLVVVPAGDLGGQLRVGLLAWGGLVQTTRSLPTEFLRVPYVTAYPRMVAAGRWFTVRFDIPVVRLSASGSVPASVKWQPGAPSAEFRLHGQAGQQVALMVQAAGANRIAHVNRMMFRLAPPLRVEGLTQLGTLSGRQPLTIRFNQPVPLQPERIGGPAVPGSWTQPDSRSWTFVPAGEWPAGRALSVALHTGLSSQAGSVLVHPVTLEVVGAGPATPLIWFGPNNRQVYLTLDDPDHPDPRVVTLMQTLHIPVMAFVTSSEAEANPQFWWAFRAAGGLIEDGSTGSRLLTRASGWTELVNAWRIPAVLDARAFYEQATWGRPPGGVYSPLVRMAAEVAGLKGLVLWSAVLRPDGRIITWNHAPLHGGEIIEMNWTPDSGPAIRRLLDVLKADHLSLGLLPAGYP